MGNRDAIFSVSDHITDEDASLYAAHKLDNANTRRVELHMADCEMCSDVIEGFMNSTAPIETINAVLDTRIEKLLPPKRINLFSTKWLAAAAMITTVIVSGILFLKLRDKETLTQNDKAVSIDSILEPTESAAAVSDSVAAVAATPIPIPSKEVVNEAAVEENLTKKNAEENIVITDLAAVNNSAAEDVKEISMNGEESTKDEDDYTSLPEKVATNKKEITADVTKQQGAFDTFALYKDVSLDSRRGNDIRTGNAVQRNESEALREIAISSNKSVERKKTKAKQPAASKSVAFNETIYLLAVNDFKNKQYAASIEKINEVYANAGMYTNNCNYYLAASWFEQQNYVTAEFYFSKIKIDKKFELREDALWFRALNAIQLKNNILAQELLNDLIDLNGARKQEAQNLLQLNKENK
ncbi:MAG: hypothetical protein IPO27_10300 [Bacteroidetes bacterium]|nr:hypothetical protein [Bacteroidota bacterium]